MKTPEINTLDSTISQLLAEISEFQQDDGSFITRYLQPFFNPHNGWMQYPGNSPFDTASIALPLLDVQKDRALPILNKAVAYLEKKALESKLWRFAELGTDYIVPFDTDSTSLASMVLDKFGKQVDNKAILGEQVNGHLHYDLWVKPHGFSLIQLKIWLHNKQASKCIPLKAGAIDMLDYEFTVTCNNLLYLGKTLRNERVWENIEQLFKSNKCSRLYYPSNLNVLYAYARLRHFYKDQFSDDGSWISNNLRLKSQELNLTENSLDLVLFSISALYLNVELDGFEHFFEMCLSDIDNGMHKVPRPFYCGNLRTDVQPDGVSPNTYFGSEALTCSLYLEFLNLYTRRLSE